MSLETLIALALLATVAVAVVVYVNTRADSTNYFQKFYAKDVSLLAEVATASPGTLVVTYDNLKPGIPIAFTVTPGLVTTKNTNGNDLVTFKGPFGVPRGLNVQQTTFSTPQFLTALRQGNSFAIRDAAGLLDRCTIARATLDREQLDVLVQRMTPEGAYIADSELYTGAHETTRAGFQNPPMVRQTYDDDSNLFFRVTERTTTTKGRITISYVQNDLSEENAYVACVLKSQFEAYTTDQYDIAITTTPWIVDRTVIVSDSRKIGVAIDIAQGVDRTLTSRMIGQMIGRTVTIYAR